MYSAKAIQQWCILVGRKEFLRRDYHTCPKKCIWSRRHHKRKVNMYQVPTLVNQCFWISAIPGLYAQNRMLYCHVSKRILLYVTKLKLLWTHSSVAVIFGTFCVMCGCAPVVRKHINFCKLSCADLEGFGRGMSVLPVAGFKRKADENQQRHAMAARHGTLVRLYCSKLILAFSM